MTQDEERELLRGFAAFMGGRLAAAVDPVDEAVHAGSQEEAVEAFMQTRHPGALGYSDDELKGTARDGG